MIRVFEEEYLELVYLSLIGLICGAINTIAGGGSLLAIPALMFFGLPAHTANASNRIAVLMQSLVAVRQFSKSRHLDMRKSWYLIAISCLSAFIGSKLSLKLDEELMRLVIGSVMLLILAMMIWNPKSWLSQTKRYPWPILAQLVLFFIIGLYGGFLQAGVGIFIITGLLLSNGMNLLEANACKVAMVACFTIPAVAVFTWNGVVDWRSGLSLGLGSAVGSWIGSHMVFSWGPKFVRWCLIVAVIAASVKILVLG